MIKVTVIENPFAPHIKNIYEFEHNPYFAVNEYYTVMELEEGVELQFALDGKLVADASKVVPQDGSHIAVVPAVKGGVGKIFKTVLMIGVMAAAMAVSAGAAAAGANAFWSAMAGIATSVVGGMLVNMLFPTKPLNLGSTNFTYNQESQTYGWDLPTPVQAEGNICGETYGTAIPKAQILGQHITTQNGKQYLSVLFCGGMGQVDEIKNIRIGYTDIGYYDDVEIDTKLGTNDQTPVKFFDYTYNDHSVNISLSQGTPVTQTTSAQNAAGLEITFYNPGGLYAVDSSGNVVDASAEFEIMYRIKGSEKWNTWESKYILKAATTSEKYTTISISDLPEGQYETRIKVLSGCISGARECSLTRWSTYTAVIPGQYCRSGKVLLSLRMMASNQLSGAMPNINWTQIRSKVYVYDWEKESYVEKEATNPIWAAYDILHQCRLLKNINNGKNEYVVEGVPAKRFRTFWDRWVEAAAYADEMILNPDGELEKRFTFNAFFDSSMKRITAAQKAASVGHAVILSRGSDFSIVVDKPAEICQIFGEGRTIQGSFNGYFSNADERAKTVEITFNPEDNDFVNTQFLVRAPGWNDDSASTDSSSEIPLFGVSRKSQAYREAIFQLAHNERQIQFAELQADIDALVCEYGDVVGIAHTTAQIGTASGRIVSANSEGIKLDRKVSVLAEYSYQIMIQRSSDDSLLKKDVVVAENGEFDSFKFCEPIEESEKIPKQYDVYCFGEQEKTVKPFRVIGVTRTGDLKVTLKLAEYDAALYALDTDYASYPLVDYTPKSIPKPVDTLILTEQTYTQKDGTITSDIVAMWQVKPGQKLVEYDVLLSEDGESFEHYAKTEEPRCTIRGVKTKHTYYVRINTAYDIVKLPGKAEKIYITGKDFPPPQLEVFSVVQSGEKLVAIIEPLDIPDISCYELRQGSSWEKSKLIGTFNGSKYEFPATENGTLTFFCKALDNSGQYSEKATSSIVNVIGLQPKNVLYEKTFLDSEWLVHGMYKDSRGYWTLRHRKKLGDYEKFADIFQDENPFVDHAEIILPVIDLGENIVDTSCFWRDSKGKLRLRYTKTLADFEKFTDIFQTKLEFVKVRYMNSTFANISVDGYVAGAGRYVTEYCTSIDGKDWSEWMPDTVTQFAGRYVQVRIKAESLDGKGTVFIRRVYVTIDVPDIEEIIENIRLSADSATHIQFVHDFKEVKSVSAYTEDLKGKQCTCYIEKIGLNSADVSVLDADGNRIAGLLQKIIIRGY